LGIVGLSPLLLFGPCIHERADCLAGHIGYQKNMPALVEAAHALTTIQFADSLVQKSLLASKKFELIILLG
jgi:hypothetical protein